MARSTSAPTRAALGGTFELGGDLPVHRLGYGAMRLTGEGIWGWPRDRAAAKAVLTRAVELGVTLIDTAESYGPHVSEELIAEALHPYPPDLVIATKAGLDRTGPDKWPVNGRPERLRDSLEGSLRRLRLDRIPLFQLHRIDPAVPEEDQFGFLKGAQQEGKIAHVGLSEVDVPQIERAQRFFRVASVQNRYNLADRQWDQVLDHCTREGIAFMPWHPLDAGSVSSHPAAGRIAAAHGATRAQVALAWLLQRSPVMLPIPGTARVAHLEENCAAGRIVLTEAEIAELGRVPEGRAGVFGRAWSSLGRGLGRLRG